MQSTIVKLVTYVQFTSMHPKSKKKTIAINTGLLAYTFTKFGGNLTNNDGDLVPINCKLKFDEKYTALSASMPSGLNKGRIIIMPR